MEKYGDVYKRQAFTYVLFICAFGVSIFIADAWEGMQIVGILIILVGILIVFPGISYCELMWKDVYKRQAQDGLKNGQYYMIISIPEDFSKNATTLLDQQPQKMKLQYITNPGSNYIASKMDEDVYKRQSHKSHI